MIVICGELRGPGTTPSMALTTALRAGTAAGPGLVQAVGVVPDEPDGDRLLQELARHGVGHAAVLRAPRRLLEPADLDLAIRYLPEVRVVVAVDLPTAARTAALDAASFAGATSIVLIADGRPDDLTASEGSAAEPPASVIVLAAPAADHDGTFAGFVAAFAVRVERGDVPSDAWAKTLRELAVDEVRAAHS